MGVIQIKNLAKFFGIHRVFENVSAEIHPGDRIGLIGANGTGKTTLLRCLLELEEADAGEISRSEGETLGYVEQQAVFGEGTLQEELTTAFADILSLQQRMHELEEKIETAAGDELDEQMKAYANISQRFEAGGGYEYEQRLNRVASGLGFTEADLAKPAAAFSGGQKTRIALAKALMRQPDYLFLDEPTNHLDLAMVEWLENYLANFRGGLLVISHDRYFLDQVTDTTWELEQGKLLRYQGGYSVYLEKKAALTLAAERAYNKQQEEIARTEEYIRRFKAGIKSKQARGRAKQLSRLERLELSGGEARFDFFQFNPLGDCAQRVLNIDRAAAGYGNELLFQDLSLLIRRGEGVALIGPNGAGKTTLLKAIIGELELKKGSIKVGSRVKIGYFAQQHENLHDEWRVVDEIIQEFGVSEERARHYLGAFLFYGDDVFKQVGSLSGGERARLALLKLMLTGANFLILDEPTNHLDIPAKEAVEAALNAFPGTFLAVSHDRYFLDQVADRVLELSNGKLTDYPGNYSDYHHFLAKQAEALAREKEAGKSGAASVKKAAAARPLFTDGTAAEKSAGKSARTSAAAGQSGSMATDSPVAASPSGRSALGVSMGSAAAAPPASAPAAPVTKSRTSRHGVTPAILEKLELSIREQEVMLRLKEQEINLPENQADLKRSRELYDEYKTMKEELDAAYEKWLLYQDE